VPAREVATDTLGDVCGAWQCSPMDVDQQIIDMFEQGAAHERDHDLVPARRLLTTALAEAATAGLPDIVLASHLLLGVIEHKEGHTAEASRHLDSGLRMALDTQDLQSEAYARQEIGFLRLDGGDPAGALVQFRRTLALAPGTGIVNLAGNALSGMGVALLDLGQTDQATTLLQAALSIRTEIEDLEQQHVDLTHLAVAALRGGRAGDAAAIARFLAASPATANGMYRHDRQALATVLEATTNLDVVPVTGFEAARRMTRKQGPII
jgi:tetratricopeptide (TPR) repeat protein